MGGGKKKEEPKVAPVTAPVFNTVGQNQGYQPTPQTFTQTGRPSWMQGHFAMPSWGMRADDPTRQVTPAMLDPRTAMFAQRDAYNAIGNPSAQQALGDGSVQDALARYAGMSSQLPGVQPGGIGYQPGADIQALRQQRMAMLKAGQIPAMGGKGAGNAMQMANRLSGQMAPTQTEYGYSYVPTASIFPQGSGD
jgi:hypothetical protein